MGAGIVSVNNRDPHTYSVSGTLGLPSGATNYLPPFFVPVQQGQYVALTSLRAIIHGGTSATLNIQHGVWNGTSGITWTTITGLSGIVVYQYTTPAACLYTPTNPEVFADGDLLAVVVAGLTASPDGLTVTFNLDQAIV